MASTALIPADVSYGQDRLSPAHIRANQPTMCGIVITVGAACVGWLVLRTPEQMLHRVQGSAIVVAMDMTGSDRFPTMAIAPACDATGAFDDPRPQLQRAERSADPRTRNDSRMSVKDNSD
jgi:hypothetical protein